jgi:membrane associated rhomboid family serine protease
MSGERIQKYLRALKRALQIRGVSDADALAEIESHLREAVEYGLHQGLSPEQAEQQALRRFGPVKTVAASFEKERMEPMQKVLLVLGVLCGLFIAYVDSRPTWDDTGITVGALLLSSGLLTLLGYRRPWLMAPAIGLWLPLYEIYLSKDFSLPGVILFPALILLICLVGAYGGWLVHLGFRKTFHPA